MANIYLKPNKGPFRDGTTPAMRYDAKKQAFLEVLANAECGDPKAQRLLLSQKTSWRTLFKNPGTPLAVRTKDIGQVPADVQGIPLLTNLSIQYAYGKGIGRLLIPTLPVPQVAGTYPVYDERYQLQVPNVKTGGAGGGKEKANEVELPTSKNPYTCEVEELAKRVGFDVVLNEDQPPFNTMFDLHEQVDQGIERAKEVEIATVMTTAANYPTGNKKTLTAGVHWDEPGGDPVADIQEARAALWEGTGSSQVFAWMSIDIWNILARNPALLDLLSLNDKGLVSPSDFAQFFGLDGVLVSEARKDSANIGQTAVYDRIWGNFFGLTRVSDTPQLRNAAFAYAPRWMAEGMTMGNQILQWFDPKEGPFGSFYYKRARFEDIVICADKTAYLITNPKTP